MKKLIEVYSYWTGHSWDLRTHPALEKGDFITCDIDEWLEEHKDTHVEIFG